MPASPQDILQAFDTLPQSEQQLVADEIIRRVAPWGVDSIDDAELLFLTAERFRSLDAEELS
ncbi:MAG: hypothetical protein C0485_13075 [Pirellula sp.]|jgi:hypothetical protein|nr:hypothetical protein [Pirellula sp.]